MGDPKDMKSNMYSLFLAFLEVRWARIVLEKTISQMSIKTEKRKRKQKDHNG